MHIRYPAFCLLLTGLLMSAQVLGQTLTCTGSFGDPIPGSTTFGSGSNPGLALPGTQTSLIYRADCELDANQYTILNSLSNCTKHGWHRVPGDHTGDPNGYMMIINASSTPSTFFYAEIPNLCAGTTYKFSAYILNLITPAVDGPDVKHPDLTFTIETTSGVALVPPRTTGTIPVSADPHFFKEYPTGGMLFTPSVDGNVVLKISNNIGYDLGNDFIIDDIIFRACGPDIGVEFVSLPPGDTKSMCEGDSRTFNLKATVDPDYQTYQWQVNKGAGWTDISLAANGTARNSNLILNTEFINAVKGVYQYRVAVAKSGNIGSLNCRVYSSPLTIGVNALPVVAAPPAVEYCEGDEINVVATGGTQYEWNGPGLPPNSPTLHIHNATPSHSGTYKVRAVSSNGCRSLNEKSVFVTVYPKVNATVYPVDPFCEGIGVQLHASGGTIYKWTPSTGLDHDDIADPFANPPVTTTYTVTVETADGCSAPAPPVTVTVYKKPKANTPADKEIFEGESVTLDAHPEGDNVTYSWSPTTGLDNPSSASPVATPAEDITYTLTVTSTVGCNPPDVGDVFVRVYKKIEIKNTFTPNGDGVNDTWQIKDLDTYPQAIVVIFNRAGQQVYRSIGYGRPWDGTLGGSALPAGTYYYVIDLKNKTPKRTGFIMLLR